MVLESIVKSSRTECDRKGLVCQKIQEPLTLCKPVQSGRGTSELTPTTLKLGQSNILHVCPNIS